MTSDDVLNQIIEAHVLFNHSPDTFLHIVTGILKKWHEAQLTQVEQVKNEKINIYWHQKFIPAIKRELQDELNSEDTSE